MQAGSHAREKREKFGKQIRKKPKNFAAQSECVSHKETYHFIDNQDHSLNAILAPVNAAVEATHCDGTDRLLDNGSLSCRHAQNEQSCNNKSTHVYSKLRTPMRQRQGGRVEGTQQAGVHLLSENTDIDSLENHG
jgi:hypothetical protein